MREADRITTTRGLNADGRGRMSAASAGWPADSFSVCPVATAGRLAELRRPRLAILPSRAGFTAATAARLILSIDQNGSFSDPCWILSLPRSPLKGLAMSRTARIVIGAGAVIGWIMATVAMILRPLPPGPF